MKSRPKTNHIAIINKFFSENNIQPNEDGYEKMRLYVSGKKLRKEYDKTPYGEWAGYYKVT